MIKLNKIPAYILIFISLALFFWALIFGNMSTIVTAISAIVFLWFAYWVAKFVIWLIKVTLFKNIRQF